MGNQSLRPQPIRRRGRPAADDSVLTVDRIVDSALSELEAGRDLSMRGLAAKLAVDPMALYHHVAHKQALLDAVLDRAFQAMDRLPRRFARLTDPLERLRALSDCYLRCVAPLPQLTRRLARGSAGPVHLRFAQLFADALGHGVKLGTSQETARDFLVDFLHGVALAGPKQAPSALRRAWPLLERALRPACEAARS